MIRQPLTADAVTTNTSTFTTASFTVPADARVLVFVASAAAGLLAGTPNPPAISGANLLFEQLNTVTIDGVDRRRITAFAASAAAATSGALTLTFDDQRQDLCAWSVIAYTGVVVTGPLASFTGSGTGTDLSITTPVTGDGLTVVAAVTVTSSTLVSPRGGATEVHDVTNQQLGNRAITLETEDRDSAASSMAWGWTGNASAAGIAVALPAVTPTPGPRPGPAPLAEQLALWFAPILHLHPAERFVPVDAKRYVENSAVWKAGSPFDTTSTWGGNPGDPYPRRPVAEAGSVSARVGEPGESIGGAKLGSVGPDVDTFLQFAGWTDAEGTSSDTVDIDSVTTYSDADGIAARYRDEPVLADSRHWYHAEYIEPDTLLARAAADPRGLDKVLGTYVSRPGLLCYHLFFPYHSESVGQDSGDCAGSITAQQALSHAGDWHCVAVLLDVPKNEPTNAVPRLIGTTVSRLSADDGGVEPPAYSSDPDAAVTMTVRSWRPTSGATAGLPKLAGGHPRIYVAAGTHSMYVSPGERAALSPSAGTAFCGRFDPGVPIPEDLIPHSDESLGEDMLAFLAKLLGGAGIGGAFGGLLGPIGLAAGLIAAGAEGVLPHSYGLDIMGYGDVPDTDKAPGDEESTVLAPPGVTVSGTADRIDWASRRDLVIDGRTYDFVVDRTTQTWWPSPARESGFQGRWGQRVTADVDALRAGPRMPDMVDLFLDALTDGDNRDLFPA
ncbi:hypothetical protein [Gordonia sp. N1V]|uniref:hypothetical protein n=1 Tax=Gordonia sp. N1V TaxID=3034163 RepID=UPI0023E0E374|nr:hypothetical protein [Gordonia sp. N1V]MDF3283551.1 hypothetical protein [Gordonia sp. N1V]